MEFLHERDEHLELALEDVFLVPGYFEGGSRLDVDLTPDDFPGGTHPIVSANMNAVTGKRMAETMARYGGLGVLPQDMRLDTVERIVSHIRNAHVVFDTPLTVSPEATLRDVKGILHKRAHGMVVVVDESFRPLGILTASDLEGRDQYTAAEQAMSPDMISLAADASPRDAFNQMSHARVRSAPVVDARGVLVGVLGRHDPVRQDLFAPATDREGRLMVATAVGITRQSKERAAALVELGVACLVVDTAHGHQRRMLETLREVREVAGGVPIVAGNVCTAAGTRALIEAGADIVKVNVGPGAMCTTRMQTGVGRPSFSSVLACAREAHQHGKHVWADGGVRHPRDVALYLAAGASRVMIGTALAGTYESPGDIRQDAESRQYKENYGMASARAVSDRSEGEDGFDRAKKGFFREGISTSRIYLKDRFESVGAILVDMVTGVRSTCTYVGAANLLELRERAVVGVQSLSGYGEGTPHGAVRG